MTVVGTVRLPAGAEVSLDAGGTWHSDDPARARAFALRFDPAAELVTGRAAGLPWGCATVARAAAATGGEAVYPAWGDEVRPPARAGESAPGEDVVTAEEYGERLASGEWVTEAAPGLVPKKITITTKKGTTYTKTVMIRPRDAVPKVGRKAAAAADKAVSVAAVKTHLTTPGHTAATLADLHKHLSNLTVADIQAVKKEHDLKGGRLKAEHIAKVLDFARAMKNGGEPKPKPTPSPKPAAKPEPKPEPKPKPEPRSVDLQQSDPNHPIARSIREDKKAASIMIQVHEHLTSLQGARKALQDAKVARDKAVAENDQLEAEAYGPEAKKKTKAARNKAIRAYTKHSEEVRTQAVNRFWEAQRDHDKAVAGFRDKVVAALKPESPGRVSHTFDQDAVPDHELSRNFVSLDDTPITRQPFETASAFVAGITDNLGDLPLLFGRSRTGRAFASRGTRHTVTIGHEPTEADGEWTKQAAAKTAVHEIGHTLEFHKPGVLQAAREFLQYRVGDEEPTSLRQKFGGEYDDHEEGRKDHFDRAFGDGALAYYVGKEYPGGNTEVISMGLEKLYEDPVRLIERDPEYAQFLFKILSM